MKRLKYEVLKEIGYDGYLLKSAPEKVMQFGEGVFLRAFANYWFDVANEKAGWNGKCVIIKPRNGRSEICRQLNEQEGLYTLYLRGRKNGETINRKRIISSVSRCLNPYIAEEFDAMMELAISDDLEYVVSNTTEAGIVYNPACSLEDRPCESFPGKLTQVLYARFRAGKPGLVILSCELIDNNGRELKNCVTRYIQQWGLEEDFLKYINEQCLFCSTLVDRIVTGKICSQDEQEKLDAENGYHDSVINIGEVFGVWNIEGPTWLEEKLPFKAAGLNCPVVPDAAPYKKRKVRILNASHTAIVLGSYLAGYEIVRDSIQNDVIRAYMNKMIYQEAIPTLPLDKEDLLDFANAVSDRFDNPFIDHSLLSISLNSSSKWQGRILPSLRTYVEKYSKLPACMAMSFAAYLAFYSCNIQERNEKGLVCRRPNGDSYTVSDEPWILDLFYEHRSDDEAALTHAIMTNTKIWGMDLTQIPEFENATVANLSKIHTNGAVAAFASCL